MTSRLQSARLRNPRRAVAPAPSRQGLQLPAAPAGPFSADRTACLAPAWPWPRFRGAAPLLRGRRHAGHRLAGDGERRGEPQVRVHSEERDRNVLLLVDQRQSMFFGSRLAMKSVVAAEAAALSAFRVASLGDRVGAIVFSEHGIDEIRPEAPMPACGAPGRDGAPQPPARRRRVPLPIRALLNEVLRRTARARDAATG